LPFIRNRYYLQRYGSPEDLISFWLRHHLLEDALRYILNVQLGNNVFLTVVNHVLSDNLLAKFKETLLKVDATQKKWYPFLINTCKYFNTNKMFDLLLEFQDFMKDHVRAGFTCIKMFALCEDNYQNQLQLLDLAKDYFLKGTDSDIRVGWNQDEDQAALLADVNKYTRTINLQKEVINFFLTQQKKQGAKWDTNQVNVSLFGPIEQKGKIAEILLELSNFDLAWKIMQEYQLETSQIYKNAFGALARKKQTSSINTIMKGIRGMMDDNEWDELVISVIDVFATELNDKKTAEGFLSQVRKPTTKIQGLIACRKLKMAYVAAVAAEAHSLVETIYEEAKKNNMPREAELCEKYLAQFNTSEPKTDV